MTLQTKTAQLRRWYRILTGRSTTAVAQGVGRNYRRDAIHGYYNDLSGKLGSGTLLGEDGIPRTEIAGGARVVFPIAVFQYGLALWDRYLEQGNEPDRAAFEAVADWALRSQRADGSWDAFGPMGSKRYTVSAMCQGEGASLLLRAARLRAGGAAAAAAQRAVECMLRPVAEGGTAFYEDGGLYLEEYPQTPRRSVLNGWVFAIFGLFDAALVWPERYRGALGQTVQTLCRTLPAYDLGYWSAYDVLGKVASPAYHALHIALLTVLCDLTPQPEADAFCRRLAGYAQRRANRLRAVARKAAQKLAEDADVVCVQ